MNRRNALKLILGAACAPAIVRPESLMRIAEPKIISPVFRDWPGLQEIQGGKAGQVFTTNGAGDLRWKTLKEQYSVGDIVTIEGQTNQFGDLQRYSVQEVLDGTRITPAMWPDTQYPPTPPDPLL